jgi:glycosyltransferase involved in cell wall biosynthesis
MKICFIGSVYPRSHEDSEVPWLRKTVKYLRESGHDVLLFVPSFRGLKSHEIDGCRVVRFRYFFAPWETLTHDEGAPNKIHKFHYKLMTVLYVFFGTIGLIRLHLREKFDVLHVHWPFPHGLFGFAAARFCGTKVVLNFYTADLKLAERFPLFKYFLRYFIRRADRVVAISGFAAGLVRTYWERDITIIPYGTTVKPLEKAPVPQNNHRILSVGRMIERKGFRYLIEAMPLLLEKWPDASLTIAGGGPIRDDLVALSKSLGVGRRVSLPGKIAQEILENLFAECQVFVLPSIVDSNGDTEGLGVVLIEAMTYYKPVIGTEIGGIVDIIIPEKTGLLIPQRDARALAHAAGRIFSDLALTEKLVSQGYAHIQSNFSWPSVIGRFNSVYESLRSPPRSPA